MSTATDMERLELLERLRALIVVCDICGGTGLLGKVGGRKSCGGCRAIGYRVVDKPGFRAAMQRLGK